MGGRGDVGHESRPARIEGIFSVPVLVAVTEEVRRGSSKRKQKKIIIIRRARYLELGDEDADLVCFGSLESALPFKINNSGYSPRRCLPFPHSYNGPSDSQGRPFIPYF